MTVELISFGVGVKWVNVLWGRLQKIQKRRAKDLEAINRIIFGDPLDIARYYVEPNCQDRNPADRLEEDELLSAVPVIQIIDKFFGSKNILNQGDNQLFILSDAGMGHEITLDNTKVFSLLRIAPPRDLRNSQPGRNPGGDCGWREGALNSAAISIFGKADFTGPSRCPTCGVLFPIE